MLDFKKMFDDIQIQLDAHKRQIRSIIGKLPKITFDVSDPLNGQALLYDAESESFKNGSIAAGGMTADVLYEYSDGTQNPDTIELPHSISDYDLLLFRTNRIAGDHDNYVDDVFITRGLISGVYLDSFGWPSEMNYWVYEITDSFTLSKDAVGNSTKYYIIGIYGLKF